eukprot:m.234457 g.234457  ORF g.234457 m.234457 type:complete len:259 (-) comp54306_c0_seq1:89-865(-)
MKAKRFWKWMKTWPCVTSDKRWISFPGPFLRLVFALLITRPYQDELAADDEYAASLQREEEAALAEAQDARDALRRQIDEQEKILRGKQSELAEERRRIEDSKRDRERQRSRLTSREDFDDYGDDRQPGAGVEVYHSSILPPAPSHQEQQQYRRSQPGASRTSSTASQPRRSTQFDDEDDLAAAAPQEDAISDAELLEGLVFDSEAEKRQYLAFQRAQIEAFKRFEAQKRDEEIAQAYAQRLQVSEDIRSAVDEATFV